MALPGCSVARRPSGALGSGTNARTEKVSGTTPRIETAGAAPPRDAP